VRDLPAARCPIMHIFDLTRILRRGCRHQAGHRESVFVSVGISHVCGRMALCLFFVGRGGVVIEDPWGHQNDTPRLHSPACGDFKNDRPLFWTIPE
jgi:hypothetical protein